MRAGGRQRQSCQNCDEKDLQYVAIGHRAEQSFGNDVQQKASYRLAFRCFCVILNFAGIEGSWINIKACTGLHNIANNKTDDQRKSGEKQEIGKCLSRDAPDS